MLACVSSKILGKCGNLLWERFTSSISMARNRNACSIAHVRQIKTHIEIKGKDTAGARARANGARCHGVD